MWIGQTSTPMRWSGNTGRGIADMAVGDMRLDRDKVHARDTNRALAGEMPRRCQSSSRHEDARKVFSSSSFGRLDELVGVGLRQIDIGLGRLPATTG